MNLCTEPFEEIFERYKGMIFHLIKKLNIQDEDHDFFQIGTIALWQAFQNFDDAKGSFSTYAYTCIKGSLLNELTRRKKYYDKHSLREEWFSFDQETSGLIGEKEVRIWIDQISVKLTKNQSIWLYKYCIEGKTPTQIAKELGVTQAQVKSWRKGAISKLKSVINKQQKEVKAGEP